LTARGEQHKLGAAQKYSIGAKDMPYSGGVESILFKSGEAEIIGILYTAWADDPRPTAILLHGIPGTEKNFDLAYQLREMGWHALVISFRGAWGSSANYEMVTQPDDAVAAIDYLLKASAAWKVDPKRIALVGYSLGSRAAIVTAYRDRRVGAVVSIAGIADFEEALPDLNFFSNASPFLSGSTAQGLRRQWLALGTQENPISIIGQLSQPVMIIQGTEDEIVPAYMAESLHGATNEQATLVQIKGADHTFTRYRAQLVLSITDWLDHWAQGTLR
jgi:pimeloyl-ACP methyl ester carboxylesterase